MSMLLEVVFLGLPEALVQDVSTISPLPADPPIGGFVWTVVIPAALFVGSFLGTYLLYKKFAQEESEG